MRAIAVDFDGVLHSYTSPWTSCFEINDGPTPGAIEWLEEITRHTRVVIHSCRLTHNHPEDTSRASNLILQWLRDHGLSNRAMGCIQCWMGRGKPHASVYLDDRGLRFEGRWPSVAELSAFTPWKMPDDERPQPPAPTLVLMVGLPRSGKSTVARSLGHPIVCPDDVRRAIHGQAYIASAEPHVWATVKTMVRALFRSGHRVVVLDACNISIKRRREWVSRGDGDYWSLAVREVKTSAEECLKRATEEGREDLVRVIKRMSDTYEAPPADVPRWLP